MTPQTLVACTGARIDRAQTFAPLLDASMAEFDITTPVRQAAFLAQVGHESGYLRWLNEIWGPTNAQRRYENRFDLGNNQQGDGFKYRGRGLLQTTGRRNYMLTGAALGMDLIAFPDRLCEPAVASRSAAWFWQEHGLNDLADKGMFETITKRINGGLNGYTDRLALWAKAKDALGVKA